MVANSDNYMGMGTGNYLPQNYTVGPAPVAPMGKGGNPAIPYPNQPRAATYTAPSQYTAQYQQQFAPQQQQRFSMPPPPQRSYPQQQQQYNLAGIMGATNLGQQQQMSRPNYQNPSSIAQLQAMYGTRGPSGGPPQQQYQPQPQIPPELQQLREANMRAYQQQQTTGAVPMTASGQPAQARSQAELAQMNAYENSITPQQRDAARNALGFGNQGPQPMGGKGVSPQAIQAMQSQTGYQPAPQQMGGKGNRMTMDMPQRPSPIGGKGASED
jgi:hypothetical protein